MTLLAKLPTDIFDLIIDRLDIYSIRAFNLSSRACHALVAVRFWECVALFAETPSVFDTIGHNTEYHEPAEFRSWTPRFRINIRYPSQLQQLAQSLRKDGKALSHVRLLRVGSREKVSRTTTMKSIFKSGAIDSNKLYTSVLKVASEKCVALEILDIQTRLEGFISEVLDIFPHAPAVQLQCWSIACLGELHSYKKVRAASIRVRKDEGLKAAVRPSDNLHSIRTLVLIVEQHSKVEPWKLHHYLLYMPNLESFHVAGEVEFKNMHWLSPKIVNLSLNGSKYTNEFSLKNPNLQRVEVGRTGLLKNMNCPRLTTLSINIADYNKSWPASIDDVADSLSKSPNIVNLTTNHLKIDYIVKLLERCSWSLRRLVVSNPVSYTDQVGNDLLTPLVDALTKNSPALESFAIDHVDLILDRGYSNGNDRSVATNTSIAALRKLVYGLPNLEFIYFMFRPTTRLTDFFYAKVQTGPSWNDTVFLFDHVDDHMHEIRHVVKSPFAWDDRSASHKVVNFEFFHAKEWKDPWVGSKSQEEWNFAHPSVSS